MSNRLALPDMVWPRLVALTIGFAASIAPLSAHAGMPIDGLWLNADCLKTVGVDPASMKFSSGDGFVTIGRTFSPGPLVMSHVQSAQAIRTICARPASNGRTLKAKFFPNRLEIINGWGSTTIMFYRITDGKLYVSNSEDDLSRARPFVRRG
jgi:hypothetical protein